MTLSQGQYHHCATYQYAHGSLGYGCAQTEGYNKTVLTTTTPGVTPLDQSASTTSSASSTGSQLAGSTAAAISPSNSSPVDIKLISGGAIAGAVAGSVLALAAIVGIFFFFLRRHRIKKEQERQAATVMAQRAQQDYTYAQYAKTDGSTLSPPMSPPMHSRHPSDHTHGFAVSPPITDNGRPWSPETVRSEDGPAELAAEEKSQQNELAAEERPREKK
ncbi:MAG: hypothetical protein LQ350_002627 [Teloschistes chrysophthalmus]|nr:MAG: hypothetical protein LQ350_002627 [Niorma chrysophthalma]